MKPWLLLFLLFFGTVPPSHAAKPSPARKLEHLPAPVQATVKKFLATGKLGSIEKTTENGEVSYDVEVTRDGKTRSISVGDDGSLLSVQMFFAETPPAVQKAIRAQVGDAGKLGDIYKTFGDQEFTYEIEMTKDGKSRDFTVGTNGAVLDMEVFLAETPAAVQKAIQNRLDGGDLSSITRTLDEDQITFDVETTKAGKRHSFTVDSKGTLLSEEILLSATPEPVQETIKALLGTGKLVRIDKDFQDGEVSYEVELKKEGKTQNVSLAPDGAVIPD